MNVRPSELVLGIFDGTHDASAALVQGGEILAAASEERFVRRKSAGGWPRRAVAACLDAVGARPADVDHLAFVGVANPNPCLRVVRPLQGVWHLESDFFFAEDHGPRSLISSWLQFESPFPRLRSDGVTGRALAPLLRHVLTRESGIHPRAGVLLADHHRAHAASARWTSGWDEALVITADGVGDGLCLTAWAARGLRFERLGAMAYPHSYGLLYATITGFLGFQPFRHEGKVMGLAAWGDATAVDVPFPFVGPTFDRRITVRFGARRQAWLDPLRRHRREDVCAWLQQGVVHDVCALVVGWVRRTGLRRVALSGGLFANVHLNGALAASGDVEEVHVFPNMGDGGLSVGAALCAVPAAVAPPRLDHAFLGPEPDEAACARAAGALASQGFRVCRMDDPAPRVVEALLSGLLVACCHGRMEFGPRALGHRTILAPATDGAVTERLNRCLDRSEFMPFAPILLAADADRWLDGLGPVRHAATFMTVTARARPDLAARCPAGVHHDGTVRPQLVDPHRHPLLHTVLSGYRAATARRGLEVPALINTSFNLHEEPIVATPDDAAESFQLAGLDLLVLGPWCVERPDRGHA
ncbi:MAG: hypothetical protein JXB39_08830 [Deltaproteobacteria bacterium]|nr:hypothetical protein [Deltaproteobacteria bacterium]